MKTNVPSKMEILTTSEENMKEMTRDWIIPISDKVSVDQDYRPINYLSSMESEGEDCFGLRIHTDTKVVNFNLISEDRLNLTFRGNSNKCVDYYYYEDPDNNEWFRGEFPKKITNIEFLNYFAWDYSYSFSTKDDIIFRVNIEDIENLEIYHDFKE